jgi:hypothetical protein
MDIDPSLPEEPEGEVDPRTVPKEEEAEVEQSQSRLQLPRSDKNVEKEERAAPASRKRKGKEQLSEQPQKLPKRGPAAAKKEKRRRRELSSSDSDDARYDWRLLEIEDAIRREKANLQPIRRIMKKLNKLFGTTSIVLVPGLAQAALEEVEDLRVNKEDLEERLKFALEDQADAEADLKRKSAALTALSRVDRKEMDGLRNLF